MIPRKSEAIKRSHDAMMKFLMKVCKTSDELVERGMPRGLKVQRQYDAAQKLIVQAQEAQQ